MIIEWTRGNGAQYLGAYFKLKEFECKCGLCKHQKIHTVLLERLAALREELGVPLLITSAFRCARWQDRQRKNGLLTAKGTSTHERGEAVDVWCGDMAKLKLLAPKYFKAIGTASGFLHLDIRDDKVRRWTYG